MRGGIVLGLVAALALPAAASGKTRTLTMRFGPVDMAGYETGTGIDRTPRRA